MISEKLYNLPANHLNVTPNHHKMHLKKKFIKEKIDILLISLESLDLYSFDYISRLDTKTFQDISNIFTIRKCNLLRDIETNAKCCFECSLLLISIIHQIVTRTHIHQNITYILHDYCHNNQKSHITSTSYATKQYLNRFKYKYQKIYRYYQDKSNSIQGKQLYNIAVANLYILHLTCSKEGLYILYKYIYISPFLISL
uniref:Uncharacterized protein n=1 Tax=Rhodogorgon sp. TaxID=2485824 RepID=A0A3G3MHS8_9FLOR|nr:hypothetical protein [Rhodogorgon sp.]